MHLHVWADIDSAILQRPFEASVRHPNALAEAVQRQYVSVIAGEEQITIGAVPPAIADCFRLRYSNCPRFPRKPDCLIRHPRWRRCSCSTFHFADDEERVPLPQFPGMSRLSSTLPAQPSLLDPPSPQQAVQRQNVSVVPARSSCRWRSASATAALQARAQRRKDRSRRRPAAALHNSQ